jgi:replicative DNA helicase
MIQLQELDKRILAYAIAERRLTLNLQTSISAEYLHPDCQVFYKLFIACFDRFHEIPTPKIMEEQGGAVWGEHMGEIYAQILEVQVDHREFPSDLEKLKSRYNGQLLLKFGEDVFRQNYNGNDFNSLEDANISVKKLIAGIDGIYGNRIFKEGSLSETAGEAWTDYKAVRDNPNIARGVHLGLREFDRITNGMQPSELMLIGGESSSGKSALSMQMGINAWLGSNTVPSDPSADMDKFYDDGVDVLMITIEMPFKALRRRIDACVAGIPLYSIRDGCLTAEEFERHRASLRFQRSYPKQFHIVDIPRGCTMAQVESKYIEKCHEYEPQLLIIDYISLMTPDKQQGSDWLNLGRLAEQMHEFCRAYNVAVISPVQLNRPPMPKDGGEPPAPDQHRVGRSIMLTQNSNILLNIKSRKDEHLKPDMEVQIAKMRDGEKGAFTLHKRLDMMRIYDDVPGWTPETYDGYGEIEEEENGSSE